ncbi:hypothetical protein AGRO_3989 [Agrobacterium sp. ATCC 31749]|nr:hypothetical protein AGRO_3989 [Agrobacterium sp. ATCC 31749]
MFEFRAFLSTHTEGLMIYASHLCWISSISVKSFARLAGTVPF